MQARHSDLFAPSGRLPGGQSLGAFKNPLFGCLALQRFKSGVGALENVGVETAAPQGAVL